MTFIRKAFVVGFLYFFVMGIVLSGRVLWAQNSDAKKDENSASSKVELSVEDAISRALEYNFDISQEEYTLKKLNIAKFASWNALIPTITAGGSYSRVNNEPDATILDSDPSSWALNRNITISTPLASGLAQKAISVITPYKEYKVGKITLNQLLARTAVNVETTYINLYVAEKRLAYLESKLKTQEYKKKEATSSYKAGLLDEYSYLQVQLAVLQSQQSIEEQINARKNLSEALAVLLGYEIDTVFILEDEIESLDISEIDAYISISDISQNLNMLALLEQEKLLKLNRLRSIFSFFPTVRASWSTSYMFQDKPDEDSWISGDWGNDTGALIFSLSIPISELHPWSSTSVAIRQLNQDIKSLEVNQNSTEKSLKQQLIDKQRALEILIKSLALQEREVTLATRAYELADDAYKSGLVNFNDYQDSEDALYNAQQNLLSSQADIIKHILDINVLVGDINPEIISK